MSSDFKFKEIELSLMPIASLQKFFVGKPGDQMGVLEIQIIATGSLILAERRKGPTEWRVDIW